MSHVRLGMLGACVLFAATPAWAEPAGPSLVPRPATLRYEVVADQGCPDQTSFENQVAARLGYEPFQPSAPRDLSVRIEVEPGGALLASISLNEGSTSIGERTLRAGLGACKSLAAAVATAVSIALDPRSVTGPIPSPTPPNPNPNPNPNPGPSEPAPPHAPEPPPKRVATPGEATGPKLRFAAELSGIASLGVTPGPSLGGLAGLAIRLGIWSVGVEGRLETTPGSRQLDSGDRVSAIAMNAGMVPCLHLGPAFGCVVVNVGAFQGESESVETPTLKSTVTSAVAARIGAGWPVAEPLRLRAHLELGIPLVRTELLIEDAAVWAASPLYVGAGVGVATLLP